MNRSSLRFPRQSLPSLGELATWLDRQDANHVLGLSLSTPDEEALRAEPLEPRASGGTDRVTPHAQMVRAFTAHQFFQRLVKQLRLDPALGFNAQARPDLIHLLRLLAERPETDGLLVCELQACVQSLARLKEPLAAPVYEALCQALLTLEHDYSLDMIGRLKELAQVLDQVLLRRASAESLAKIDPDLLDEFQLLPGVWPVFKERYEQLALQ